MPEQLTAVDDGLDTATLREAEYGGTPLPLIRQIFAELLALGVKCTRFLEPGCGPAPFCAVAREVWNPVTAGVELRDEEEDFAMYNVDALSIGAFDLEFVRELWLEQKPDLAATNPPFTLAVKWAQLMLEAAGRALLLLPSDWHSKSEQACEEFERSGLERHIAHQWLIPGRIGFYGPGHGTDRITYSWWLLTETGAFTPGRWPCARLPRLPSQDRRWTVRPGT